MKQEFNSKNAVNAGVDEWVYRCLDNPCHPDATAIIKQHWKEAKDGDDFKNNILSDKSLAMTQGYAELSKKDDRHWYRVRAMFGERTFKTEADAGGVLLYDKEKTFSVLVPNGYGDGTVRVAVFDDRKDFNAEMMNYFTCVDGNFMISDYDCWMQPIKELSGRYGIYYYDGLVAFVRWK